MPLGLSTSNAGRTSRRSPPPGSAPAVARILLRRVVQQTGVRDRAARRHGVGQGRRAHDHGRPSRAVPLPAGPRRPDRLRRGLHGGRLGQRRAGRRAHPDGARHGVAGPAGVAVAAALVQRAAPDRGGQRPRRRAAQHRPALRPVQRAVRDLPRRDHELLLGAVQRTRRVAGRGPAPQGRPDPRRRRSDCGQHGARDRDRLGRAGPAGRRPGRPRHQRHAVRASRPHSRASGSSRPGSPTGSRSGSRTTATSRAASTRSSASR